MEAAYVGALEEVSVSAPQLEPDGSGDVLEDAFVGAVSEMLSCRLNSSRLGRMGSLCDECVLCAWSLLFLDDDSMLAVLCSNSLKPVATSSCSPCPAGGRL